jgi:acyl-CoA synthetase (AMP-forming)/AMP-acid ligase II
MGIWNSLRIETWRDVLEWSARIYGEKPCVVSVDTGKRYNYQEFNARVNKVCNTLLKLGVKKGERVAILSTDLPEFLEVANSVKAGFAIVPLNWRLKPNELAGIINDCTPAAIFAEAQFAAGIDSIRAQVPTLKHFICFDGAPAGWQNFDKATAPASAADPGVEVVENDLLGILYTSGTTGVPKGVIKKHRDVVRFARLIDWPGQINSHSRCLGMWPLFHAALLHANFPFLMFGATTYLYKRFDAEAVLKLINDEKITHLAGAPTMLVRMINHPNLKNYDMSSLHSIAYAASPMPVEALKIGMKVLAPVFHQGFGMTEATGQTALTAADHVRALTEPGKEHLLSSVGKPLPGCQMKLVDDDDRDVKHGAPGEIVMRSDAIIEGYWNRPQETAELLKGGWMHTGDIGRFDVEGYLYIVDRKKDVIVSGGEKIASKEVEAAAYEHPAVMEAAVIGVPSDQWGEDVKLIVSLKPGMSLTPDELQKFTADKLGGFKKPKSVEIWPDLPKNPAGKILKREMREKYWAGKTKRVN